MGLTCSCFHAIFVALVCSFAASSSSSKSLPWLWLPLCCAAAGATRPPTACAPVLVVCTARFDNQVQLAPSRLALLFFIKYSPSPSECCSIMFDQPFPFSFIAILNVTFFDLFCIPFLLSGLAEFHRDLPYVDAERLAGRPRRSCAGFPGPVNQSQSFFQPFSRCVLPMALPTTMTSIGALQSLNLPPASPGGLSGFLSTKVFLEPCTQMPGACGTPQFEIGMFMSILQSSTSRICF